MPAGLDGTIVVYVHVCTDPQIVVLMYEPVRVSMGQYTLSK